MKISVRSAVAIFCIILVLMSVEAMSQASTMSHGSFDFNTDGVIFQSADTKYARCDAVSHAELGHLHNQDDD